MNYKIKFYSTVFQPYFIQLECEKNAKSNRYSICIFRCQIMQAVYIVRIGIRQIKGCTSYKNPYIQKSNESQF